VSKLQILIAVVVMTLSIISGLVVIKPQVSFAEMNLAGTKIAFTSTRDGNQEIYVMNADGSALKRLTHNNSVDYSPWWSPDGTKIAFYSDRDGKSWTYVMNADGSEQTKVNSLFDLGWGRGWSPDGSKYAYYSGKDGNWEIYVENADGTKQLRLTDDISADEIPLWSPDSSELVFQSMRDGNWDLYRINADGSNLKRLTNDTSTDYLYSGQIWQPDGDKILFTSYRGQGGQIYTMHPDGSAQTALTAWDTTLNQYSHSSPSWSPDGNRIVYVASGGKHNQIYTMNQMGSGQVCISDGTGDDTYPQWSPILGSAGFSGHQTAPKVSTSNLTTTTSMAPRPDLVIDSVEWSPEYPSVGKSMTFSVTVRNHGTISAGYSQIFFKAQGGNFYIPQETLSPVGPGMTITKYITGTPVQTGAFAIEVSADSGNMVPESNENNNNKQINIAIVPASSGSTTTPASNSVPPGAAGTSSIVTSTPTLPTSTLPATVLLETSVNPKGSGNISPQAAIYDNGALISLTAVPGPGYQFLSWSGDVVDTSTTITITMNSNMVVVANFKPSTSTTTKTISTVPVTTNLSTTIPNPSSAIKLTSDQLIFEWAADNAATEIKYLGKLLQINGTVAYVGAGWLDFVPPANYGYQIRVYFDGPSSSGFSTVTQGDIIAVLGVWKDNKELSLNLHNGAVISGTTR
jgi:Tol biopolymer transport system component